jgi:hypothetical protein
MQKNKLNITGSNILCIYEGNAEKEILEMLLDADKLSFTRDDLINTELVRRASGKHIAERYLNYESKRPVVIIRVIDSRKEKFILPKPYSEMYTVLYDCYTRPEIEILLIILHDELDAFHKTGLKPSAYCKARYNYTKKTRYPLLYRKCIN